MKDGKIFGKINIIDMIVIVAIIAAIAGFAIRVLSVRQEQVGKEQSFEVVVKVDGIRKCSVDALERGGKIFSNYGNKPLGKILKVEAENVKYDLVMLDGTRKLIERPDQYTAYVTLRIDGTVYKGKYFDDVSYGFSIGSVYNIFSKYASTNGTVISIKSIKSAA